VGFREVSVVEVRELLRAWQEGHGLRRVAERAGVDRKTARRYVAAAEAAGLARDAGGAVTDELVGAVVEAVRPARPNGHGASWQVLLAHEEQIRSWVTGGRGEPPLSIVKVEELLARRGVQVPYRTLHRFAVERCGFGVGSTTGCDSFQWPHRVGLVWRRLLSLIVCCDGLVWPGPRRCLWICYAMRRSARAGCRLTCREAAAMFPLRQGGAR
jgi:hypothetical protein